MSRKSVDLEGIGNLEYEVVGGAVVLRLGDATLSLPLKAESGGLGARLGREKAEEEKKVRDNPYFK